MLKGKQKRQQNKLFSSPKVINSSCIGVAFAFKVTGI
jgi:hypothetical protein